MAPTMELPAPIRRIGPYRVSHLLGSGGMAEVFAAEHEHLGQHVALKLLRPEAAREEQLVTRFLWEGRVLARLDHPGVVRVLNYERLEGTAFLAMELLRGLTLREWMRQQVSHVPLGAALALAKQIAATMADVHAQGIVHRDLKPENVFLCPEQDAPPPGYRTKVVDFGLAKLPPLPDDALGATQIHTHESAFMGTYLYMAPEQLRSAPSVDGQADVYALGVLLFELLAGRHPFQAPKAIDVINAHLDKDPPSAQQFVPSLPGELCAFVTAMLAKEPSERPTMRRCADMLGRPWEDSQGTCPVPGLAPFTETQAELFFGREAETQTLLGMLDEARAGRRRWVQLEGPSGVGKSSLLQAGVLPRLRQDSHWRVLCVRPGHEPLRALAQALTVLTPDGGAGETPEVLRQSLLTDAHALRTFVTAHVPPGCCLLLVLEPMEELFTLGADECPQMGALLAQALATPDCPLRLLTSLRGDFQDRLSQVPTLARHLQHAARYPLLPMEESALAQVVRGMARGAGLRLSEGLADRMVRDARNEAGRLPLLGHALHGLWAASHGAPLTLLHYDRLGGVGGALAQQAEALLSELGTEGQERAKWILLSLVQISRNMPDTRRPRTRREVLDAAGGDVLAEQVLMRLSGMPAGGDPWNQMGMRLVLLSEGADPGQPRVDLVHETLLHKVPLIARWIEKERALLQSHEDLEVDAKRWETMGCPVDALPTGTLLKHYRGELQARHGTPATTQRVSPVAARYLQEGEREERRRARRKRLLNLGAILAVLAILFYAIRAEQERRTAERERQRAEQAQVRAEQARQHTAATLRTYINTVDELVGDLDWKLSWIAHTLAARKQMLEGALQALSSLPIEEKDQPQARHVEIKLIQRLADVALHDETLVSSAQHLRQSHVRLMTWGAPRGLDKELLRLLALNYSKHGKVEHARGDRVRTRADFSEAVRLMKAPGVLSMDLEDDRRTLAVSLQELAESNLTDGDHQAAAELLEEAIALHERNGRSYNKSLLALAHSARGEVARRMKKPEDAKKHFEEALGLARDSHAKRGDLYGGWVLARVLVEVAAFQETIGDRAGAQRNYEKARELGQVLREGEPPSKRFALVWLDAMAGLERLETQPSSRTRLHTERCGVARDFQTRDPEDARFRTPQCE